MRESTLLHTSTNNINYTHQMFTVHNLCNIFSFFVSRVMSSLNIAQLRVRRKRGMGGVGGSGGNLI